MNFDTAASIELVTWAMRLSDWPRSTNRARIDSLGNGAPPYTENEMTRDKREINVNDLTLTRIAHDARMQLYAAFNKPGDYFRGVTDMGAVDRRQERSVIVTKEISRIMRRSNAYFECERSKFAATIMHGIGPGQWEDQDHWCPLDIEIADVLIPADTRLTMRNLPFFAVWRGYTANELRRLTRNARTNPEKNPGWNIPVVDRAIEWADKETAKLYGGANWNDYWVPEKMVNRVKDDSGIYASDRAATIACWDFYFWDDYKGREGWRRRLIFDAYGGAGAWDGPQGYGANKMMPDKNLVGDVPKDADFLFSSRNRVVADSWENILHFQFADLSAKAPFTYHGVRSLGWMLYALCHLQNRFNCAFWEQAFEQLLSYLRVNSLDEAERALKIELSNRGIIDESVHFLTTAERWQPNTEIVNMGLSQFGRIIQENSASYLQNQNWSRDRVEKTKFQVMAEVQAMQTLISAGLQQCYRYQTGEYREIFRRFMRKDSSDPDVIEFQARCIKRGVPERMLVAEAWDIQPERIMGGGNKTLELAAAQQLMEWRAAFPAGSQERILRKATLAILDDAAETELLLPSTPKITDTKHEAAKTFGTLMAGTLIREWPDSINLLETVEVLIGEIGNSVTNAVKTGGMVSMDKFAGYQNVLVHIGQMLQQLAQDKPIKERVKMLAQLTGKVANQVKAFGQRLQQQMKAGGDGDGKMAESKAKVQSMMMQAAAKRQATQESHAQRTAQRQVQFEMEQKREDARLKRELQRDVARSQAESTSRDIETASTVRQSRIRSFQEPEGE